MHLHILKSQKIASVRRQSVSTVTQHRPWRSAPNPINFDFTFIFQTWKNLSEKERATEFHKRHTGNVEEYDNDTDSLLGANI